MINPFLYALSVPPAWADEIKTQLASQPASQPSFPPLSHTPLGGESSLGELKPKVHHGVFLERVRVLYGYYNIILQHPTGVLGYSFAGTGPVLYRKPGTHRPLGEKLKILRGKRKREREEPSLSVWTAPDSKLVAKEKEKGYA